jgi:TonB family protein
VAIAINPSPPSPPPPAPPSPPTPAAPQPPQQSTPAQTPPAQASSQSTQAQSQQQQPPPGKPGLPGPTADPAPPSDRESDPFAETNSFKFVNGRVSARNGRWVKTVKPRITDAGWNDMSVMSDPNVTLLATVDTQGNVVHVVIYRSSGSEDIDLPCEEALNQWKIEPSKDAGGHTVQDVVSVTFGWVP